MTAMGDVLAEAGSPANRRAVIDFLFLTGYKIEDVLSLNYQTRIFLTRNGGKYRLKNKKIIRLEGPSAEPTDRL